jgi:DNA primase
VDLRSLDGKARLAALAKPLLAQLPEGIYRELLTTELARRVGLPRDRLDTLLGNPATTTSIPGPRAAPATPPRPTRPAPSRSTRGSLSRQAIALLLHYPAVAHEIPLPENLEASGQRGVELLRELHALARSRPDVSPPVLLERFRDRPELPHLAQLLAEESLVGAEGAAAEFRGCLGRLLSAATQQELARLMQKASQEGLSGAERERLATLQRTVVAATSTPRTGPPS